MKGPDELFSFGGVATINDDFSESGGDTSGLFDDAHSDGSGVGGAWRHADAGDERWWGGSERYFVGVAGPGHGSNGRGEMHVVAHYDAGWFFAGGAFVCGSSVGVFAALDPPVGAKFADFPGLGSGRGGEFGFGQIGSVERFALVFGESVFLFSVFVCNCPGGRDGAAVGMGEVLGRSWRIG